MAGPTRRALFLDRDGVINIDSGYVGRIEDCAFVPGIFDLVRTARQHGLAVVVVTNQSGIARGLFTQRDFRDLSGWMLRRFVSEGAPIDRIYHCPFHPQAILPQWRADHPWRKPNPGMLLQAAEDMRLNLPASVMVGDQPRDVIAAQSAGVGLRILLNDDNAGCSDGQAVRAQTLGQAIAILVNWLQ